MLSPTAFWVLANRAGQWMETAQFAAIHGALSLFLPPICLECIEYLHDFLPSSSDFFQVYPILQMWIIWNLKILTIRCTTALKRFRRTENQHSHIKKLCEQRYQWALSTHRSSAPGRPDTVILKSVAKDYAIISLLPFL